MNEVNIHIDKKSPVEKSSLNGIKHRKMTRKYE